MTDLADDTLGARDTMLLGGTARVPRVKCSSRSTAFGREVVVVF